MTSHLAVEIPESGNNKCRLSIGDETREWINGEIMLFDTSIMHDGDEYETISVGRGDNAIEQLLSVLEKSYDKSTKAKNNENASSGQHSFPNDSQTQPWSSQDD